MNPRLPLITSLLLLTGLIHTAAADPGCGDALLEPYFATQEALAGDDLKKAQLAVRTLHDIQLSNDCPEGIAEASQGIANATDIKTARVAFKSLSDLVIPLIEADGVSIGEAHLVHCPMAFDFTGASWLQKDKAVANPYFGAEMFACGFVKQSFESAGSSSKAK